ncbi:MAG: DUF2922 domain-containing protein [Clostridiaceae bacterium]
MKTLVMTFLNESGKKVSLNVPTPKDALTEVEINTAMDTVISKGIFYSTGGNLISKDSAKIIDKTTTEVTV